MPASLRLVSARAALALCCALAAGAAPRTLRAQQVADSAFVPDVGGARWPAGTGPRLVLDEAHENFHTLDGRYLTFGRMASAVGFRVGANRAPFSDSTLRDVDVLVIANALHPRNATDWHLPTPSAFTDAEIAAVQRFVEAGGGLLLIADHMPFAGAAERLGRAFGVQFANGFALDSAGAGGILVYRRDGGGLTMDGIVQGSAPVDSIVAFTGSAFRLLGEGMPLLTLPPGVRIVLPVQAWVFGDSVPSIDGAGWLQGAALRAGRGRVAVLGEAAMLSAQRAGAQRAPMGMNEPRAAQNARFAAQLLRWLAGDAEPAR